MDRLDVFNNSVSFPSIKVTQPIGEFYIGSIKYDDLTNITKVDVRRMEDDDLDAYIGIQRKLSESRVKDIYKYVNSLDATFPSSVILAVPEECAEWNEETKTMTLRATEKFSIENVATIIDGQHRVEGLKEYGGGSDFEINVSIFVGAPVSTQANIFATVNLAQTKVNKSLVYDLYDYEKKRSPQKSAHHLAVALDSLAKSPLHEKIKRLGTATAGRKYEQLTQATFVEALLPYMTSDAQSDRNSFLKKMLLSKADGNELQKHIFRNLFIENKDELIAEILLNYFQAVQRKWSHSWDDFDTKGNILPKTNGFIALMGALRPIYKSIVGIEGIGKVPSSDDFFKLLQKVESLEDGKINTDIFKPGSSGSGLMKKMILKDIFDVEKESDIEFS